MSPVIRKPAFCICENKDADQLRGNREADQRLCFRHIDSTIPLLPIYEISSLLPTCVVVQPGLCWIWSETPKTGFVTTTLISLVYHFVAHILVVTGTFRPSKLFVICILYVFMCAKWSTNIWLLQEPFDQVNYSLYVYFMFSCAQSGVRTFD